MDDDDTTDRAQPIAWDIRRKARAWTAREFPARADRLPELALEIYNGKLFFDQKTRLLVLAMLLENVGIDAAIRLGDPARWREAVEASGRAREPPRRG